MNGIFCFLTLTKILRQFLDIDQMYRLGLIYDG